MEDWSEYLAWISLTICSAEIRVSPVTLGVSSGTDVTAVSPEEVRDAVSLSDTTEEEELERLRMAGERDSAAST